MWYIALGGVSHFDWPYRIFAIIVIFCLLETKVWVRSEKFPSIPPFFKIINQLTQPCQLTGFSACAIWLPDGISVFPPSLDLFWFVTYNDLVFVFSFIRVMPPSYKRLYIFNEVEAELSCKHLFYWLQNQHSEGFKIR